MCIFLLKILTAIVSTTWGVNYISNHAIHWAYFLQKQNNIQCKWYFPIRYKKDLDVRIMVKCIWRKHINSQIKHYHKLNNLFIPQISPITSKSIGEKLRQQKKRIIKEKNKRKIFQNLKRLCRKIYVQLKKKQS